MSTRPARSLHPFRALVVASGLGVVAFALANRGVPCGFARMFHVPCPGCGSTRAVLALASGDLAGVLRHNPFGPVMAVLLFVVAIAAIRSSLLHGDLRATIEGRSGKIVTRAVLAVVVLEIVVWIARFFGAFGGPVPV